MSKPPDTRRTLADTISITFMKQLCRSPDGRAHLLALVADTERNDEGRLFTALERHPDPLIRQVVHRHAGDEALHAQLLDARIAATVSRAPQLPHALDLLRHLDAAVGGVMSQPALTRVEVMRAYLLLQVIEERAVTQLPLFIEGFRETDPESARLFERLLHDERRHLGYCHAVARRCAPSAALHNQTLSHYRRVEARVFAQGTLNNLRYVLDAGLMPVSVQMQGTSRALAALQAIVNPPRPTGFTALLTEKDFALAPQCFVLRLVPALAANVDGKRSDKRRQRLEFPRIEEKTVALRPNAALLQKLSTVDQHQVTRRRQLQ